MTAMKPAAALEAIPMHPGTSVTKIKKTVRGPRLIIPLVNSYIM